MPTVPERLPDAIDWCTNHLSAWPNDPTTIGLSLDDVADLASLAQAAASARTSAQAANDAKLVAFADYNTAGKAMRDKATALVAKIRGTAKASADPQAVYSAALIPAPADREPTPAPGTPYEFTVALQQSGAITLSFKCDNPGNVAGVTYKVERQDEPQGAFNFVTIAQEREFTDNTVPAGSALVTYRVTAARSTRFGMPAEFNVRFGAGNQAQVVQGGQDAA